MEQENKKTFLLNVLYYSVIIAFIYISVRFLFKYMLPFIIAVAVAYLVQKPAEKLASKLKIKYSIIVVILSAMLFIVSISLISVLLYFLSTRTVTFFKLFSNMIKPIVSAFVNLKQKISDIIIKFSPQTAGTFDGIIDNFFGNAFEKTSSSITDFAAGFISKFPAYLFGGIVSLVSSCYISKDYKKLVKFYNSVVKKEIRLTVSKIIVIVKENILKMIKGYLILSGIVFLELLIGLLVVGIKNPLTISLLIAIVDLLPVFGAGTVLIPWGLISIFSGSSRGFFIIIIYIVTVIVRNFAEPKIIGNQIGINPLFTLVMMFVGLKIAGFLGLILFPMTFVVTVKYFKESDNI